MHYAQVLAELRGAGSYGVSDLAARAGLSRPTLYRLLAGAVPRTDDLQELAIAAGQQLDFEIRPLSDPLAAVAGRSLLGDESVLPWAAEAGSWRERLERFTAGRGPDGPGVAVIDEAGRASAPQERAGAVHLRGAHRNVDRLVSAGQASRQRWALSGWAALDALGIDVEAPTIMWVEDVRTVGQLLGDSFRSAGRGEADLLVIEAHPSIFAGASAIEDVHLVTPLQAYIDAAGLGGDPRDRALAHLGGAS
jgi:transcriptional regulator with XRE-family HTH domain